MFTLADSKREDRKLGLNNDQPELSLQAPVVNNSPGPEYADGVRMFQGIPSLERAKNGRLWALWYGGGRGEGVCPLAGQCRGRTCHCSAALAYR